MLLLNFDNRKSIDGFFLGLLCTLPSLSLLLADTTDHLEHLIRGEVGVEVVHERIRVKVIVGGLHPCKLVAIECA